LTVILADCVSVRRRKSEQAQQLMLWKIDYEDIDFLSDKTGSNLAMSTVNSQHALLEFLLNSFVVRRKKTASIFLRSCLNKLL